MVARLARDDEVTTWQDEGWVVLDGLVGADEIDAAARRAGPTCSPPPTSTTPTPKA